MTNHILGEITEAIERRMAADGLQFALTAYQNAVMSGSIDAQLSAGQTLFDNARAALPHLVALQYEAAAQPRLGLA